MQPLNALAFDLQRISVWYSTDLCPLFDLKDARRHRNELPYFPNLSPVEGLDMEALAESETESPLLPCQPPSDIPFVQYQYHIDIVEFLLALEKGANDPACANSPL